MGRMRRKRAAITRPINCSWPCYGARVKLGPAQRAAQSWSGRQYPRQYPPNPSREGMGTNAPPAFIFNRGVGRQAPPRLHKIGGTLRPDFTSGELRQQYARAREGMVATSWQLETTNGSFQAISKAVAMSRNFPLGTA